MSRFLVAPLASTRSLLSLHGADAAKFLQGLVSNDVSSSCASSVIHRAVYAGFFSAQGRVLHDTFILHDTGKPAAAAAATSLSAGAAAVENGYIVDYPRGVDSPALMAYIKRYILRSKVKARAIEDKYRLWAVFSDPLRIQESGEGTSAVEDELQHLAVKNGGRWWRDSRSTRMGYRLLLPPDASSAIESSSFQSSLPSLHSLLRTISNVPEAPVDLVPNQALPLESNMDIMSGIDFRKGCYIGQELTARTWHTGVIRKRIVPVRLYRPEDSPPTSLLPTSWSAIDSVTEVPHFADADVRPLANSDGTSPSRRIRSAGRLGSVLKVSSGGEEAYLGLALVRLEVADDELGTSVAAEESRSSESEAGVNAAGGMVRDAASPMAEDVKGEWRVKTFRETLQGAR